ncbi:MULTISPECIES: putative metalloprotease CJM1_0395 family protein [unclassified Halomonas]|uniref:putative metalloprotease CJM1_0395 family protein n=1 Tax=unclassified Halomonas TaxID=2609666 RepID=UPI0006DAEB14|nr:MULTISPECIES: putative metalloprotease CJM1_0395 family protein [unclassified Halomonas]KPQ19646.1 MAG: SprA-related family [Halomonas sp. HL-93]SBR51959.1 SprA-related family protein [Halomonas sp. HL-93]SNY98227.1 SprA-related family protein [Halomonas sp. hl-4]
MTIAVIGAASLSAWASPTFNAGAAQVTTSSPKAANDDVEQETAAQDATRDESAVGPKSADGSPLAPEEIEQLNQLKQTDREVRQHEMAHQTVGGAYAGGASYDYEVGPDGQRYAVAGEVSIDYGPVPNDPDATIEKMQTVIAAALAPADPSPKDYQVAAQARQYLLEAKLDAAMQRSEMDQARAGAEGGIPSSDEGTESTSAPNPSAPRAA